MSFTPSPAAPPASPWADNTTVTGDGVVYKYDLANNALGVYQNDVSSSPTSNSIAAASLTPDKMNFGVTFLNTPPVSPSTGQAVVVGTSPTGDYVGHENALAIYDGAHWQFTAPYEGLVVWDQDANVFKGWNGSEWVKVVPDSAFTAPAASITTTMLADGAVTSQKSSFKVISKALTAAPTGAQWDVYIVAATPAGGDPWFGQAGKLAVRTGTGNTSGDWTFYSLAQGKLYYVADENELYGYTGSALLAIGPPKAGANIPITSLSDFADIVAAQVRNIVSVINADSGGGGALLTLKAALGVGNFRYAMSYLGLASFPITNTTTGTTGAEVWTARDGGFNTLPDGAKDVAVSAGDIITGIPPFTAYTKTLVSWSTSGGGTGVWDIAFTGGAFSSASDYKVLDALSPSFVGSTFAVSNKTANGFRISTTGSTSPAAVIFSIYALN